MAIGVNMKTYLKRTKRAVTQRFYGFFRLLYAPLLEWLYHGRKITAVYRTIDPNIFTW